MMLGKEQVLVNRSFYKNLILIISILFISLAAACSTANPTVQVTVTPVRSISSSAIESKVMPVRFTNLSFAAVGRIEAILAVEGVKVKKGDVIARLEGAEKAKSTIAASELQVISAQQALDKLNDDAKVAKANAEAAVAKAQTDLKDAVKDRKDLNYKRVNQYTLEGIQAQYIIAQNDVKDAEDAYDLVSDLEEDNSDRAEAMLALSQARLHRDQVERNLNYALGAPDARDIAEADAKVAQIQATLDDAQRQYERVKSGPNPKDLTLDNASLNNAQAQLEAAKSTLTNLEMTAPFDGTIVSNTLEVGEIASSTSIIVLGDLTSWQIETTDLKEEDVVAIKVGSATKVHFDAISDLELDGVVNRIKAIGEDSHDDIVYTVYIDLLEDDPRLLWNMTARVNFLSAEQ
jgi:HlyD family secretion protein